MVDLLPILQPLPSTNFGPSGPESSTMLSHTSALRRASSPSDMYCEPCRERSQEGAIESPRPIAAKGYVARNHSVLSLLATRPKNRSGSAAASRRVWELRVHVFVVADLAVRAAQRGEKRSKQRLLLGCGYGSGPYQQRPGDDQAGQSGFRQFQRGKKPAGLPTTVCGLSARPRRCLCSRTGHPDLTPRSLTSEVRRKTCAHPSSP